MNIRIVELKDRQVVSVKDGTVIGYITDLEFNVEQGNITSVVVLNKSGGVGIFSKNNEVVIPWENIELIGNDSILVNYDSQNFQHKKKKGILSSILYGD